VELDVSDIIDECVVSTSVDLASCHQ
jgi:hypothetical protein